MEGIHAAPLAGLQLPGRQLAVDYTTLLGEYILSLVVSRLGNPAQEVLFYL